MDKLSLALDKLTYFFLIFFITVFECLIKLLVASANIFMIFSLPGEPGIRLQN